MSTIPAVVINDCTDANALGRQQARLAALVRCATISVPVHSDLEASGNIVDHVDAFHQSSALILANVAPRNGSAKHWPNGTPFCYFWCGQTLVVSSFDGLILSLVKKFKLTKQIELLDIPTVAAASPWSDEIRQRVQTTQFRSFEFLPRVAGLLLEECTVPSQSVPVEDLPDAPAATVWWIDNFGNCKTTALPEEIGFVDGGTITAFGRTIPCYQQLKSVPDNTLAAVVGSSGYGNQRLVEIVTQGGNAAQLLGLTGTGASLIQ